MARVTHIPPGVRLMKWMSHVVWTPWMFAVYATIREQVGAAEGG